MNDDAEVFRIGDRFFVDRIIGTKKFDMEVEVTGFGDDGIPIVKVIESDSNLRLLKEGDAT